MTARLLFLALLVLSLAACDSGDEESALPEGTFTLRVDGGETRTFAQAALFGEQRVQGFSVFGILLGLAADDASPVQSAALIRLGQTPPAGTYTIGDLLGGTPSLSAFQGFYIDPELFSDDEIDPDDFDPSLGGFFYARSGSVTIDRSESRRSVEGQFTMSVQAVEVGEFDPNDPRAEPPELTPVGEPFAVEGAFNARFQENLLGDLDIPAGEFPLPRLAGF